MGRNLNSSGDQTDASSQIIVEFVGVPGVGKSTLSRRTAAVLMREHPRVAEPIRRIDDRTDLHRVLSKGRFVIEHVLRHPRTALLTTHTLLNTNQTSYTDQIRVNFNLQYVSGIVARARSNHSVTLLDQGPYQGIWSVGLRSSSGWGNLFDRFDQVLSHTTPDLVVCVDAAPETIAKRLNDRSGGDSRLSADSSELNRAVKGYERLKSYLATVDCRTITVTNETKEMLEPNAMRIVEEIRSQSTQSW